MYSGDLEINVGEFDTDWSMWRDDFTWTYAYSFSSGSQPTWLTIEEDAVWNDFTFTVNTNDQALAGHNEAVTISATSTYDTQSKTTDYTFNINITDPCSATAFETNRNTPSSGSVILGTTVLVELEWINDDFNDRAGGSSSPSFCGLQTVTVAWNDPSMIDPISTFVTV